MIDVILADNKQPSSLLALKEEDCVASAAANQSASLNSVLQDLRCSTKFLSMTINRCVDYTRILSKESNESKLKSVSGSPKLPLRSTSFPVVNVKKAVDEMIAVMKTVSLSTVNICPHFVSLLVDQESSDSDASMMIETDKEWLEDNVLCLLSNAVKFAKSKVDVTVSVIATDRSTLVVTDDNASIISEIRKGCDFDRRSLKDEQLAVVNGDVEQGLGNGAAVELKQIERPKDIKQQMLRIEVKDDGPGIQLASSVSSGSIGDKDVPTFDWNRIMPQQSRPSGGLGLGLYCLARRVEALGGKYGIGRNIGESGTTVWFSLPCRSLFASESSHTSSRHGVNLSPSNSMNSRRRRNTGSSIAILMDSKERISSYSSPSISTSAAVATTLEMDDTSVRLVATPSSPLSPAQSPF